MVTAATGERDDHGTPPAPDDRRATGNSVAGAQAADRVCPAALVGRFQVSRLWINNLLDRRDAIAGAQLP